MLKRLKVWTLYNAKNISYTWLWMFTKYIVLKGDFIHRNISICTYKILFLQYEVVSSYQKRTATCLWGYIKFQQFSKIAMKIARPDQSPDLSKLKLYLLNFDVLECLLFFIIFSLQYKECKLIYVHTYVKFINHTYR